MILNSKKEGQAEKPVPLYFILFQIHSHLIQRDIRRSLQCCENALYEFFAAWRFFGLFRAVSFFFAHFFAFLLDFSKYNVNIILYGLFDVNAVLRGLVSQAAPRRT